MGRTIAAVIVGYIVLAIVIMISFSLMFILMTADRAFIEGTTEVTMPWLIGAIVISFVAAVIGGLVASMIDRVNPARATTGLAGLIIVLGLISAFVAMSPKELPPGKTPATLSTMEAAACAKQPVWYAFSIPFIGAAGVMLGGRWRARRSDRPS